MRLVVFPTKSLQKDLQFTSEFLQVACQLDNSNFLQLDRFANHGFCSWDMLMALD